MSQAPVDIIKSYLKQLTLVTPENAPKYSYIDATIINKKVSRLLLNLPVNSENNFDVITAGDSSDTFLTSTLFTLYEEFIRLDIFKITGISYSEYKQLTMIERELILLHVELKIDVNNIDSNEITNNLETNNGNDGLFNR